LCSKEKFGLIEVSREEEFAPVKNAPGEKTDTPESARKLYLDRDRRWLTKHGFK
jgi:UDP-N-acetylglucosamine/UDP-N-acetylgalactosamine diphosphorylase